MADAEGRFRIGAPPPGPVEVQVRAIGYRPVTRAVVIAEQGVTELAVALVARPTELAPVVVTAARDEQRLADAPAAVSVADSTTIAAGRSAGLDEVLRYVPGVQATSRYGLDDVNLSIRGSGIRTTFGARGVAVLVDGVPVTEPDGQTRLDLVELAAARQVEVLRGPASALYGGVASGGAINIISRSGAESRGVALRVQRGSYDFQKYDGYVGTTFAGEHGAVLLSGAHTVADGFRAFSRTETTRLNLRSEYRVARRARVTLEASTSDLDTNIPGALTLSEFEADPYAAVQTPNVTNRYARRDTRRRIGLRLDRTVDAGWPIEATAYAFYGWRDLDHPIYQVIEQDLDRVQLGARVRLPLDRGTLRFTVGADYDRLGGADRRYVNQGGERGTLLADLDQSLPNLGIYGQLEAAITSRLTLTVGGRYDRVTYDIGDRLAPARSYQAAFDQFSPRTTASYRLGDATHAYVSVARGFEVPTTSELAVSPDPDQAFNTTLHPKTLWNYEAGVKSTIGDRAYADLAVFQADVSGEFISRTIPTAAGPRTVFENAGRSRNRGVELGWTVLLDDAVDLVGSYTFSDFTLTEFTAPVVNAEGQAVLTDFAGKRLPGVPRHRIAGEIRARPLARLTTTVGAEWQSRVFVDNGNTTAGTVYYRAFGSPNVVAVPFTAVDPYGLVHLSASYEWRAATVFASIENLFDTRYVANVTINDGQGRFYNAGYGRYLAVGLRLTGFPQGF